jgi:hypothetical protein
MILRDWFHKGLVMINEFLRVASIAIRLEEGQTKSGRRTAQFVVSSDLDHDHAVA